MSAATLFDGRSAAGRTVLVRVEGRSIVIVSRESVERVPLADVDVSEAFANAPATGQSSAPLNGAATHAASLPPRIAACWPLPCTMPFTLPSSAPTTSVTWPATFTPFSPMPIATFRIAGRFFSTATLNCSAALASAAPLMRTATIAGVHSAFA